MGQKYRSIIEYWSEIIPCLGHIHVIFLKVWNKCQKIHRDSTEFFKIVLNACSPLLVDFFLQKLNNWKYRDSDICTNSCQYFYYLQKSLTFALFYKLSKQPYFFKSVEKKLYILPIQIYLSTLTECYIHIISCCLPQ